MDRIPSLRAFCGAFVLICAATASRASFVSAQPFSFTYVQPGSPFINYGDARFGDLDGDGRQDIIALGNISGNPPYRPVAFQAIAGVEARNPLNGIWEQAVTTTDLDVTMWHGGIALRDFDGDGDLDAVVTGATNNNTPFAGATLLLVNSGGVLQDAAAGLPGLFGSSVEWIDYDSDGDVDILLMGAEDANTFRTVMLQNDGGSFTEVPTALPDLAYGDVAVTDFDNDGDTDVFLSGASDDGSFLTDAFRNTDGEFEALGAGFPTPAFSSIDLADFDLDGDPDVLLSGGLISPELFDGLLEVYRNDGGGFQRVAVLPPTFYGEALWGDYDSDGDPDIIAAGSEGATGSRAVRVFENTGDAFPQRTYLTGVSFASVDFSDYDGDLDPDVLVSGLDRELATILGIYRNDHRVPNTAPAAPSGLSSSAAAGVTTLSWDASVDEQSGSLGLTYNVRVGTAPGAGDIVSPTTVAGGSRRLVSAGGNADQSTSIRLRLPQGSYFWSVQAIDPSYTASAFAAEQTLSVTGKGSGTGTDTEAVTELELGEPYPNPSSGSVRLPYAVPPVDMERGIEISVFNVLGARVLHSRIETREGRGEWSWNHRDATGGAVASGVYFVRLTAGSGQVTRSLIVID